MRFYDLKQRKHFEAKPSGFKTFKVRGKTRKAAYAMHGGKKYYRFMKKGQ